MGSWVEINPADFRRGRREGVETWEGLRLILRLSSHLRALWLRNPETLRSPESDVAQKRKFLSVSQLAVALTRW